MLREILFLLSILLINNIISAEDIQAEVDNNAVCQRKIREPKIILQPYYYPCCTPLRVRCKRSSGNEQRFGYNCIKYRQTKCKTQRKLCVYVERVEKYCCNGHKLVNGICKTIEENECHKCQHSCDFKKSTCTCLSGYELRDKFECLDIDECKKYPNICGNAECKNTKGSFYCKCKNGYELQNSTHCVDINECKIDNICQEECFNTPGSHFCQCKEGLRSNGSICLDINECKLTNRGGCSHSCKNDYGSYSCSCPLNMKLGADNHTCYSLTQSTEKTIESSSFQPLLGAKLDKSKKNTDGVLAGIIVSCIVGTILLILLIIFFYKKGWCNCCMAGIGVTADSPKKLQGPRIDNVYVEGISTIDKKGKEEENDANVESLYVNNAFKITDLPPNYKDVLNEINKELKNNDMTELNLNKEMEGKGEISKEEPIYGNVTNESEAEAVYVNVGSMS
ncbi:DgyrCDS3894 [Dimorphilus gyrociliatus]|uniref:DgyrCDS3894 n=1 Tax=Dimorphilus gyrociliatus TaxID=2664684 RepID=A0A7I8VHW3_9ANNE|nr:DgyrCDS3894 [Dimorphilus gyrociliatus]